MESSSCKYMGIDIGGNGMFCGTGDGKGSGTEPRDFAVLVEALSGDGSRLRGSGLKPELMGLRTGDDGVPVLVHEAVLRISTGVEVVRGRVIGRLGLFMT